MKKISIIPEIMNSEKLQILDENNIPFTICNHSEFKFFNTFRTPYIVVDNFDRQRFKDVEIKKIDIGTLERLNLRLVSIKATSKTRNRPRQTKCYMLENLDTPIPNSEILARMPKEHSIQLDTINNRVRIKGKNSYPYHRSQDGTPWVEVIENS